MASPDDATNGIAWHILYDVPQTCMAKDKSNCCICKIAPGTLKIKDGNPAYAGRPICKECQGYRKLMLETR